MSRRFTIVTLALVAVVAFLVGAIIGGGGSDPAVLAGSKTAPRPVEAVANVPDRSPLSFADIVQGINAAVVNVESTVAARETRLRSDRDTSPYGPDLFDGPFGLGSPRGDRDGLRRGVGTGFIIDPSGSILTNHHVVDRAERISVKLSDGRTLRARVVGTDPDTDIALLKVEDGNRLPVARLGRSSALRMGDWVCAIGNPLGYEHTVTVGVVSYIGRKLFDSSLDSYIQTDAAINLGNSGGPLINAAGEVIGINAAISARGSSIGFAVPIDTATEILPQLIEHGRVERGYMGVTLTNLSLDLQRSLNLPVSHGAVVQDLTKGSPGERAGLRPYDVILSVDDREVANDDELIHEISAHAPGSVARVRFVRDGREQALTVKLAERRQREGEVQPDIKPQGPARTQDPENPFGLSVRDLDRVTADKLDLPAGMRGVLVTRVEPMSSSYDADLARGTVLLEVNRRPVESVAQFKQLSKAAHSGDIVTLYVYVPAAGQRQLKTIRVDDR
jgi:serine protease Do